MVLIVGHNNAYYHLKDYHIGVVGNSLFHESNYRPSRV